ncbi:MAG: hypothetical protein J1E06_03220 [Acutalibacter sp.]|nr:hypothetical protein [Acutalibacter sp.]
MTYKKILDEFLSTCSGKVQNVFFKLYLIIESLDESEQLPAFIYICDKALSSKSDYSKRVDKEYYTEEQVDLADKKINKKFVPLLDSLIEECAKRAVEPIDFYSRIWSLIQSSIFRSKRERALAVFRVASHDLIPYRNVGIGLSMEEEQFQKIVDSLGDTILDDTQYILKLNYEQKTQRASLLVDKLLALESRDEQAVYMAIIMSALKKNIKGEIDEAIERI